MANNLAEAQESVDELRENIARAINFLEELEGYISDTETLPGVGLTWNSGCSPDISNLVFQLSLDSATYEADL